VSEQPGSIYFDANGVLTEHRWIDGQEVIVHYDDVPESDITVVDGIRCTNALRTLIDIAPDLEPLELSRAIRDCLEGERFTVDEALARIAQSDMQGRLGATLLRIQLVFMRGRGGGSTHQ
jgi:hypothetical protein